MRNSDISKCKRVLKLFVDLINEQKDMCITYSKRVGFIVLEYCKGDYFESNYICNNVSELYKYLLGKWEFCWKLKMMQENGVEEFSELEDSLTEEQKNDRYNTMQDYETAYHFILMGK